MGLLDPPAAPPLRRGTSIAFVGDSITAGSSATYNYGDAFPVYAVLASAGKLVSVGYYGVGGETTTQMLSRVSTALAKRPTYLHILGGTNDIGQGVDLGQTDLQMVTTIRDNITSMCRSAKSVGATPILGTIPPANAGAQRQRTVLKANVWIRRYAIINGYPLVDYYTLLAKDGFSETPAGNWKAAYALDGIHPNATGHGAMGALLADALTALTYSYMPPLATDVMDTANACWLVPNVMWKNATSQPGIRPDNANALGAPYSDVNTVYSLVTDSVIPGNLVQVAMNTSATQQGGVATSASSSVTSGDVISCAGMFTTDGVVGFQVQLIIAGTTYKPMNIGAGTAITRGMYYMEVPAPTTGIIQIQLITANPAGSAATVKFGYPSVTNLTTSIGESTPMNAN